MCCAKFFNQMKRDINFDINIAEIQVKKERETVLSTVKIQELPSIINFRCQYIIWSPC